jgi:DNA invertase Pin-like site-specific DNA recombinase
MSSIWWPWRLDARVSDNTLQRPALQQVLQPLKVNEAGTLRVVKLDRLTCSVKDLGVPVET